MLKLFRRDDDPAMKIGPDGMTDFSREMHRQWRRRDEAKAKIEAAIAERTGIDADLIPHIPYEYMTLALLLGVRIDEGVRD